MLCWLLKVLCQSIGKQEKHVGTHAVACTIGHMTKGALYKSCELPFSIILSQWSWKLNKEKKRLICTRQCKYTQVWCLGQFCYKEVRVFPSNWGDISTCVNELTGYHDCYRCITLLDKYYGHQCYRIHFLMKSSDIEMIFDLGVTLIWWTQIEVEFILNCLFTKSQIQRTPDALNLLANSVL